MNLRVDRVDASTADDETLLALHRVHDACDDADPGVHRTPGDALAYVRNQPADEPRTYWLAYVDEEPVGRAMLHFTGSALSWGLVSVIPEQRRRGIGTTLFAAVLDAARAAEVATLAGFHCAEAGAAFAARAGARDDQRDVRSVIDLRTADVPEPRIPTGYALRSWTDAAPDEVLESYAAARNAINDAPAPDGHPIERSTPERVRELEALVARRGRQGRVTVATAPSGEVAAYTELRVSNLPSSMATTEDTATVAEYRGLGLASAVKAESLRRLKADRPDVGLIPTTNAEANAAMLAVNRKLGFVPIATLTTVLLPLDPRP